MNVKQVQVTYGRKFNLGDYNSAHVEMSVWADLGEGDDEAEVALALRRLCRENVKAEFQRVSKGGAAS